MPTVIGDQTQLVQLFQNLLGNAMKFHRDETPQIRVTASPTTTAGGLPSKTTASALRKSISSISFILFAGCTAASIPARESACRSAERSSSGTADGSGWLPPSAKAPRSTSRSPTNRRSWKPRRSASSTSGTVSRTVAVSQGCTVCTAWASSARQRVRPARFAKQWHTVVVRFLAVKHALSAQRFLQRSQLVGGLGLCVANFVQLFLELSDLLPKRR